MSIDTQAELIGIKAAGEAVAIALKKMQDYAAPGMSTKALDDYGKAILQSYGAYSAPKKDYKFPGWTCISVNNEVCHGIPSRKKIIKEGDLVNIDVSAELNGFYGDNGASFILGEDHQQLSYLVEASREILYKAINHIHTGVKIADIGGLIEKEAKSRGLAVVKNICGHGIGRKLHESPAEIPCYRDRYNKERFTKNTVIALETFISTKANYVYEDYDGWTLSTRDNSFVAQHEHTLMVTDEKAMIFTKGNGV